MKLIYGLILLLVGLAQGGQSGDETRLNLADLAAYQTAIDVKTSERPATVVSFRDLWDHPDEFRGRRVKVQGRVVSVFHQGAVGQFPRLAEIWLFDQASNPFCLVFPETAEHPAPKPGRGLSFSGTFLRQIRYQGGDTDRLAPLIVGPEPPSVEHKELEKELGAKSPYDNIALFVVGGVVVVVLLSVALRRPQGYVSDNEPSPSFVDQDPNAPGD